MRFSSHRSECWFVVIALLVVVCVSSYGATYAGHFTGPSLFSLFRNNRNEGFAPQQETSVLINGGSPDITGKGVDEPDKVDPMLNIPSSKECVGKSSGLTTSSGGLCIPDDILLLLRTRGGNATFPDETNN
jgi:hypothetical protein